MLTYIKTAGLLGSTLMALALATSPALADGPVADRSAEVETASFNEDRQTILAMAGNYAVEFDMRETTPWMTDYEPIDPKVSRAYESVRVIEDTGEKIVLQHLLVVGGEDEAHVIKHWRQDWQYEPQTILTYAGPGRWEWSDVPERMRAGRWSQTVYQVDDSPRYAGWGQWETTHGVRRWRSNWTMRPLARRDAVRHPIYDRYAAINRHQLTPQGWIHWQDNTKMMPAVDGSEELQPVVQESVLNTYERFDRYNIAAADEYWSATKDYWAAIRQKWSQVSKRNNGLTIAEEPETGTVISGTLLTIADQLKAGDVTYAAAVEQAERLIEEATSASSG